ncbi:hypothetical protein ACWEOE_32380 [Amycolatopsis sp. NPDC004368]
MSHPAQSFGGLPIDEPVHHVAGGWELDQELDRYLGVGYDIERAADGWVVLRRDGERIAVALAG